MAERMTKEELLALRKPVKPLRDGSKHAGGGSTVSPHAKSRKRKRRKASKASRRRNR